MAFLQIISDNIVPLLVFVAIGYLLDLRYHLDVISLNKLTFFIVLPSFIFYSIYVAEINMTLLNVFLMAFVQMFFIALAAWVYGKFRGMPVGKIECLKNGTMFSNNGNIGIALIALVFGNAPYVIDGETPYLAQASACATIHLVQMNMTLNTLGLYQAGKGKLTPRDAISVIFHMPVIYTLVAVFTIKFSGFDMTQVFLWPVLKTVPMPSSPSSCSPSASRSIGVPSSFETSMHGPAAPSASSSLHFWPTFSFCSLTSQASTCPPS